MIISENIKVKLTLPVIASQLENVFLERSITPLRWAIVAADADIFTITISYNTAA